MTVRVPTLESNQETSRQPERPAPRRAHARHHSRGRSVADLSERFIALPWSVVAVAIALLVGIVHTGASSGHPLSFGGDQAVLAMRVHDATRWHATLGPYSRFGWSHPGPALFYLFAPVYALSGGDQWSLLIDCLIVNGAAVLLAVAVLRHFAGEWTARWGLMITGMVLLEYGALSFETLWNPNLEGPAVLLLLVSAAGAFAGSSLSLVGAALVGTYLVQTDIGTGPLVAAVGLVAAGGCLAQWANRRRADRRRDRAHGQAEAHRRFAPTTFGFGLLGILVVSTAWIPPVTQQITGHPGNISRLIHFFRSPPKGPMVGHSNHSLSDAWHVVANTVSAVPFGVVAGSATFTESSTGREAVLASSLAVSVLAVGWAWRRHHAFAIGLGAMSLIGLLAAIVAATRIVGPIYSYLMLWAAFIPVPAWIAIGLLVGTEWHPHPRMARPAARWPSRVAKILSLAAVVPVGLFAWQLGHLPWATTAGPPEIPPITSFATAQMRSASTRHLVIVIASGDRWPVAAGVMLGLMDEGYHPTIQQSWAFMFTQRYVSGSSPSTELVFSDPLAPDPAVAASAPSVTVNGTYGDTRAQFVPAPP